MECDCGCGRKVKTKEARYVRGHNPSPAKNKGKIVNLKIRQKTSETLKEKFRNGEIMVWNKGIKGICKPTLGCFKKGYKPWNYIDGRSKKLNPARYGDDWDKIRYVIYLRDKFTCQHCGITGIRLDIHHKNPYLYSGDNSIENLITLCRSCHMEEEQKLRKEEEQIII